MKRIMIGVCLTVLLGVEPSAIWAQAATPAATWTSFGPDGPQTAAIAIDPQHSATLYAATNGGIFKSTDGGKSWNPANSGLPTFNVSRIVIGPQDPSQIYALTGSGIFKSTDAGTSWNPVNAGLPNFANGNPVFASALAVAPQDSNTLYVALCCQQQVLFKSTDGGANWSEMDSGLSGSVSALAADARNPGTVYAGSSGPHGVFKTSNGGATWTALNTGVSCCIGALALDPRDSNTLYAGLCCTNLSVGILKSTNAGATWALMSNGFSSDNSFGYLSVNALAIDSLDSSTLYAATDRGLFKSTNAAAAWSIIDAGPKVWISALAVDPQSAGALYAGTRSGLFKSVDKAATWSTASFGLKAPMLLLYPGAAASFAVTTESISRSVDGGANWILANAGLPANPIPAVALDAHNSNAVYAGVSGGGALTGGVFKSADAATTWNRSKVPHGGGVEGLTIDPQDPNTLYAWNFQGSYKTTDGSATWNIIQPADFTAPYCFCVRAIVVDPHDSDSVYGIRMDGVIKSKDGGASWSAASSGLTATPVRALAMDPQDGRILYAWDDTYNPAGPNLFKTSNGGASWNAANSGLQGNSIAALVIHPQNTSTLYALSNGFDEAGMPVSAVFTSVDAGASWQLLNPTLPRQLTSYSLAVDATHLYAATFQGGFAISIAPATGN